MGPEVLAWATGGCLRIGASVTVPRRGPLGRTTARVGPAAAVLRRVGPCSLTAGADHAVSEMVSLAQSVAVISAQQKPASSRATAAASTDLLQPQPEILSGVGT